jgi:hypothetical protein
MECFDGKTLNGDDLQEQHNMTVNPPQHFVSINGEIAIVCQTREDAHTIFIALQQAKTVFYVTAQDIVGEV